MGGDMSVGDGDRLTWFTSSYSAGNGGMCVEVASDATDATGAVTRVRDSKNRERPGLAVRREAWTAFVRYLGERQPGA